MMFNKDYRLNIHKVLMDKRVVRIFVSLLLIIFYALLIATIKETYDFTIGKTFLSQLVQLLIGVFLFSYIHSKGKHVPVIIIESFFVQSLIMVASFLNENINSFLDYFRSSTLVDFIDQREWYQGIRGLGIAGSNFFGLAIGFGILYILIVHYYSELPIKSSVVRVSCLIIIVVMGTTAGRISLVGLGIAAVYALLRWLEPNRKKKRKVKLKRFNVKSLLISFFALIVILISSPSLINLASSNATVSKLLDWALEFYYKFQATGQASTSSTSVLKTMYFNVKNSTLLFGDGRYTNQDNTYYMHTDAGYMRNILFFGLIGLLFLIAFQMLFFDWRKDIQLNLFLIVAILIFHIKGETIGFALILQSILFLNYLSHIYPLGPVLTRRTKNDLSYNEHL